MNPSVTATLLLLRCIFHRPKEKIDHPFFDPIQCHLLNWSGTVVFSKMPVRCMLAPIAFITCYFISMTQSCCEFFLADYEAVLTETIRACTRGLLQCGVNTAHHNK